MTQNTVATLLTCKASLYSDLGSLERWRSGRWTGYLLSTYKVLAHSVEDLGELSQLILLTILEGGGNYADFRG